MIEAPAPPAAPARTVGDVLLRHGAITEGQLGDALARQRSTGQPLGQILVESGVISRLNLASALAEQWSDAPDLIARGPSRPIGVPDAPLLELLAETPAADVDGRPLAEVRSAVQVLAARLVAVEARAAGAEANEARIVELRQMVTGLADWASGPELRIAELEAVAATLGTDVDGLASRLDQLIAGLDGTVAEIEEHTGGIAEAIEQLGARLEACVTVGDHASLRAAVEAAAARPLVEAETLATVVSTLEERLEVLSADLVAIDARVEDAAVRTDGVADTVGGLGVDGKRLGTRLDELDRRLAAIVAPAAVDPEAISGVDRRVDELAARLDGLAIPDRRTVEPDAFAELRATVATLAERPPVDAGLEARVDQLSRETLALARADQSAVVKTLEARLDALATQPAAVDPLAAEIVARLEALESAPPPPRRANAGAMELARLAARIDELDARLEATGHAGGGVAPGAPGDAPAAELDKLRVSIESLWMRMSEFQRSIATLLDPRGIAGKLDAIERRLESVEPPAGRGAAAGAAAGPGDLGEIARRIEDMEAASSVARETLLTNLERIASSIDWRLQRLERPSEPVAT